MSYLSQIQKGIDYIERHLEEDVKPEQAARAAGMSRWHFQRIFKAITAETLKSYVRGRRMAHALDALRETDRRILDVAIAAGFDSHESFTRAFKKLFGLTPLDYRKRQSKQLIPRKSAIDEQYLKHIHRSLSLIPRLHRRPEMCLVGLKTLFYSVDSERNNIGQELPQLWDAFMPRLQEIRQAIQGTCYGVIRPTSEADDLLEYHAAIEVRPKQGESLELPSGMSVLRVPACLYASFCHAGPAIEINRTVDYIYSTWLLQSDRRHNGQADLEVYDHRWHPTSAQSAFDYAIPLVG